MRRFRVHIGTLVVAMMLLGVGLAALREPNEIWDHSIFSITLGVLLISILLAIHRTDQTRAFWLGFALFGWTYLGLSLVPSIESRMITTKTLHFLDSRAFRSSPASGGLVNVKHRSLDLSFVNSLQQSAHYGHKGNTGWVRDAATAGLGRSSGTTGNIVSIAHSLVTLIAAFVGGLLSHHVFVKNRESELASGSPHV
jgi:hypothetical protein